MNQSYELTPDQLRIICAPDSLDFNTTSELLPTEGIIGQPRATRAMDFGIEMPGPGFNIYVQGPAGTGRMTTVAHFLTRKAAAGPVPDDWCYVYNFAAPSRPRALHLPAGMGRQLRQDMAHLVEHLRKEIPRVLEGEEYAEARQRLEQSLQETRDAELRVIQKEAEAVGFGLMRTPAGIVPVPVVDGQPMTQETFNQLPPDKQQAIEKHLRALQEKLSEAARRIREQERRIRAQTHKLERDMIGFVCNPVIEELKEKYKDLPEVLDYLEAVRQDIIEHGEEFKPPEEGEATSSDASPPLTLPFLRYRVNLLVDNAETQGAPVIIEHMPTYYNLIGRIEQQVRSGAVVTDFTMIRPGALHRANGGYLVVYVRDVMNTPFAWDALKRALKNQEIRIQELDVQYRLLVTATLEPEPIPLQVKVVLIGSPWFYYLLYSQDEDFRKLFKVRADFASDMERNEENIRQYSFFIAARCQEENLPPFDRTAVAKVVEYGSRLVEDQTRLSTHFGHIADLVREAGYWARENSHNCVTAEDVQKAIEEKVYRSNLIQERLQRRIEEGDLLIDTEGEVVGQVNGLSLLTLGDYTFARPSRITCRTYMGKGGVVNIEREAKLSGRIHNKGVLTLAGYLGGQYAQDFALSLSASLSFEQLYEEVEGDSAASAELYALLSSLSGLPIKQGIAVTGSVDQYGQVQPIGGVTYKVEGFYDACRLKGLTGEQGVIIPKQNVKNLMLREDVVEAVREGRFHIWAVSTVDEGISILTGVPAGERGPDGRFPEGTVHRLVEDRLREMAEGEKKGKKEPEEKTDDGEAEG